MTPGSYFRFQHLIYPGRLITTTPRHPSPSPRRPAPLSSHEQSKPPHGLWPRCTWNKESPQCPAGLRPHTWDQRVPYLSDLQVLQLLLPAEDGLQTADPDVDVSHQHRLPDTPEEDAEGGAQVLEEVLDEPGVLVVVKDWNTATHTVGR